MRCGADGQILHQCLPGIPAMVLQWLVIAQCAIDLHAHCSDLLQSSDSVMYHGCRRAADNQPGAVAR